MGLSPEEQVTFVPMAAVDESAAAIASPQVRQFREVAKGYTYMEEGDVIFAKITPCMQNGKHAILTDTLTGIAFGSTEFHVLRPTDQVLSTWVHRFLLRPELLAEAQSRFTGTAGQQRVPKDFLIEKAIPLPPLKEQHQIVIQLETQLAAAKRARQAAHAQLDALDAMSAALLREIFPRSPSERLPLGWRWVKLEDVCEIVNGSTPKSAVPEYWDGDICWITPADLGQLATPRIHKSNRYLTREGYDSCSTKLVPSGAVVLSSRAPIGHLAIAETPLCTNQGCKSLVPTSVINGVFLYYSLKRAVEDIRAMGSGATFAEIGKRVLSTFEIPIPPLQEQTRLVGELEDRTATLEHARAAAKARLDAANALPAALLQLAFPQ